MMVEFEDRNEEQQRRFLEYLERLKTQPKAPTSPEAPKAGCLWRLIGRLYLAYWRWRYRRLN
jgi:hypothetical protein